MSDCSESYMKPVLLPAAASPLVMSLPSCHFHPVPHSPSLLRHKDVERNFLLFWTLRELTMLWIDAVNLTWGSLVPQPTCRWGPCLDVRLLTKLNCMGCAIFCAIFYAIFCAMQQSTLESAIFFMLGNRHAIAHNCKESCDMLQFLLEWLLWVEMRDISLRSSALV